MKKILTLMLTLVIILSSSMAFGAMETDAISVLADTFVLRPLGFAALLGGSVAFIISLPVASITNSVDTTAEVLIKEPYKYTFVRPVGEIR